MKKLIFGLGLAFSLALLPGLVSAAFGTPVPLSPKNNAVGYNVNTTFLQWTMVPGANGYLLQVKKGNNNFGDSIVVNNANYKIAKGVAGVANDGGTYYWRVKVDDADANWSSTFKFSSSPTAKSATIVFPKLSKNTPPVINLNAKETTFSWKNDKNTAYNEVEMYMATQNADTKKWTCGGDPVLVPSPTFTTTSFSSNLLIKYELLSDYYCWQVVSYTNDGNPTNSTQDYFKLNSFNQDGLLRINPIFAQYNFDRVAMYWSRVKGSGGEEKYKVKVSINAKFDPAATQVVNDNYLVTHEGEVYDYVKVNANKKLYWQVGIGEKPSIWSKVASFQPSFLGKSTLLSPKTNTSGKATLVPFTWSKGVGEASFYKLEFKMGTAVKNTYYTTNRSFKPAVTEVFDAGVYTWTVTAYNNNSISEPSEPFTFTQTAE